MHGIACMVGPEEQHTGPCSTLVGIARHCAVPSRTPTQMHAWTRTRVLYLPRRLCASMPRPLWRHAGSPECAARVGSLMVAHSCRLRVRLTAVEGGGAQSHCALLAAQAQGPGYLCLCRVVRCVVMVMERSHGHVGRAAAQARIPKPGAAADRLHMAARSACKVALGCDGRQSVCIRANGCRTLYGAASSDVRQACIMQCMRMGPG